ncbi:MAG: winged helix-turn-helix domain-containing protein [Acidobacteriia bacterium]|nr:winged helix-turn-helix domain-containing protein [Terriglobia bacterium]
MAFKAQLGETAGEIYILLESEGALTTVQLKKKVNAKGDMLSYALGWLARENKIEFVTEKNALRVQLK